MHTEDALHQLAAAGAHQAADAQNLAPAHGKAHALDLVVRPDDVPGLEDHLALFRFQLGIHVGDLPAHHHLDELVLIQLRRGARADVLAVPVNAHPIADGENLRHAVGDVDDGHALFLQAADMLKQQLHLPLGDGGGGLVHDDDLGVDGDGLDDLDQLALGHGQVAQRLLGRDVESALLNELLGFLHFGLFIHQAVFPQLPAHENIFIHGHVQDRVELLVDHGHARIHSLLGIGGRVGLAVKQDLAAGVLGVNPHQDLHQGRLACAVLAHQCMDLSRPHLQLNMIQRLDARKGFTDIFHFQYIFHAVLLPSHIPFVITLSNAVSLRNVRFSHDGGGFLGISQKYQFCINYISFIVRNDYKFLHLFLHSAKKSPPVRRKADRGWLLGHFYRRTRTQRLMRVMYTSSPSAKRSVSWGL